MDTNRINGKTSVSDLSLALLQFDIVWEDVDANLKKIESHIERLQEVDLLLLPEMFSTGFTMQPEKFGERNANEVVSWMRRWSEKKQMAICGSLCVEDSGKFFNRLFIFDKGDLQLTYDKRHLFSLAGEEIVYNPGTDAKTWSFKTWRIRPFICYDLRFPVWSRNTDEIDLYLYVANWPERRIEAWEKLLQARAIENMAFVAAVNRVGEDGNEIAHNGASQVVNSLGRVIKRMADNEEGILKVDISRTESLKVRERFGFLKDRDAFILQ